MISSSSRFNLVPTISVVDSTGSQVENRHVDLPYKRSAVVSSANSPTQEYYVQHGDTWSNIAARFLKGRSDLWWVIAEYSGILDPFEELAVGTKLKIPAFSVVMLEVLNFDPNKVGALSDDAVT